MDRRRKGRSQQAGALLPRLVAPALRKQGFAEADIVTRWRQIVGPVLADHSVPDRLRMGRDGGTLWVTVEGAFALEMQHLQPVIIDRINGYFGFQAVSRLNLRQAPLPISSTQRSAPAEPTEKDLAESAEDLAPTEGGETPRTPLTEALIRLGARMKSENRLKKSKFRV